MLVVLVHVHVKPECVEQFRALCVDNASHSIQEPGITRFDVLQQQDDPTRFVLVEAYRDAAAAARHKETDHYARWRDGTAGVMAEPRFGVKYEAAFPADVDW